MNTPLLAASMLAAFAAPAFAETAVLTDAYHARSLHLGSADLVAYHTSLDDGAMEITAMYRADGTDAPHRVVMRLADQDKVSFSLPVDLSTSYTFARIGDTVTITGERVSLLRTASR